ncbi:MAG: terminase gpA endonuclease subunit [Candidatus Sumerlaeota bacterium]
MTDFVQRDIFGNDQALAVPHTERDRDRQRKREKRATASDINIPDVINPERRERCRNPLLFLQTYFPHWFYMDFSRNHREMIAVTSEVMLHGGNQALAEPRGDGKTTIQEAMTIWGIFYCIQDFILYLAATGPDAIARFTELMWEFEHNDLLAEDFPEFIYPIRALEGNNQRQGSQKVGGVLTGLNVKTDSIVFANIPGTAAQGQKIATAGLESSIRGKKHRGRRPGYVMGDDPSTSESAASFTQNDKRIGILNRDVAGTEDPSAKIACVLLCTIIEEGDLADQLTDREENPTWQGIRRKMLQTWPERRDLCDKYVEKYREDQRNGDRFARGAHAWYIENRAALEAGAEVSNPLRYFGRHMNYRRVLKVDDPLDTAVNFDIAAEREKTIRAILGSELTEYMSDRFRNIDLDTAEHLCEANVLPDGTEIEISAVQHALNIIAERGMRTFLSEYQNEPTTSGDSEKRLTVKAICEKVSHLRRSVLPDETEHLVMFIDIHKVPLYYVIMAAGDTWPASIIDYNTYPDRPDSYSWNGDELERETGVSSLEGSIWAGMEYLGEKFLERTYTRPDGLELAIELCLIDAGWGQTTDTVYKFSRECAWKKLIRPSHGEYIRASGKPIHDVKRKVGVRKGHNWVQAPAPGNRRVRLVRYDTNYWKSFVHARLAASQGEPGSLTLFGDQGKRHHMFATQILAERAEVVTSKARGRVEEWTNAGKPNHYLDAVAGCCVALNMVGCHFDDVLAASIEKNTPGPDGKKPAGKKAARRRRQEKTHRRPKRKSLSALQAYKRN